jgi:hypothetical protein
MNMRLMRLDNSHSLIDSSVLESSMQCVGHHIASTLAEE